MRTRSHVIPQQNRVPTKWKRYVGPPAGPGGYQDQWSFIGPSYHVDALGAERYASITDDDSFDSRILKPRKPKLNRFGLPLPGQPKSVVDMGVNYQPDRYFKDVVHTVQGDVLDAQPFEYLRYWLPGSPQEPSYSDDFVKSYRYNHLGTPSVKTDLFQGQPSLPTLASIDVASLARRALLAMTPKVNDGISGINFLLELRDLRRMVQIWDNRLSKLRNLAGGHLNYAFGWAPFLGDIRDIYKGLKNLRTRVRWLLSNQGRVLKKRYKRILPGYADSEVNAFAPNLQANLGGTLVYRLKWSWVVKPTYHATLIYRYTMPKLGEIEAQIDAFFNTLGVRWDPSIVWNAIRFSFVIDWFTGFGPWLRTFTPEDLGIQTEIVDFCHSVKSHRQADVHLQHPRLPVSALKNEFIVASSYRYRYERARFTPSLRDLYAGLASLSQLTLGASLIIATKPRKSIQRRKPSVEKVNSIVDNDP